MKYRFISDHRERANVGLICKVLKIFPSTETAIVERINMVKRHTKPNPMRGVTGGIIEKEAPIDASNVMLFNPAKNGGDRIGFKTLDDGRKVRVFKSDGEVIDV